MGTINSVGTITNTIDTGDTGISGTITNCYEGLIENGGTIRNEKNAIIKNNSSATISN